MFRGTTLEKLAFLMAEVTKFVTSDSGKEVPEMVQHLFTQITTRCNTLQHAATCCNTLYNSATPLYTYYNTLQHAATRCNTLYNSATPLYTDYNTLQHAATRCNTLYNSATSLYKYYKGNLAFLMAEDTKITLFLRSPHIP